jgi:hypothetical protein
MDRCTPLDAFELSGSVELLVFHEELGLGAVVSPERLIISGANGTSRIRAPFAATLSLLPTMNLP